MRRIIRPQMRGPMEGALVEERGCIFSLPVDLPPEGAGVILDRIELALALIVRDEPRLEYFTDRRMRAIKADLARLREML